MSVIQKIRDKGAIVIIVVICVAIVSFLLQDAFFGKSSMISQQTAVGKVNGESLEAADFERRVSDQEAMMSQNMPGNTLDAESKQYIREQVWNSFINEQITKVEYAKLGIVVTEAELADQYYGKHPHPMVLQQFGNPQTGEYNPEAVRAIPQQIRQSGAQGEELRRQLIRFEQGLTESLLDEKYKSLLKQGVYYPKWLAAQQETEGKELANISYVNVPYATVADSTVKVSASEINDYIQKHKSAFEMEEGRNIEYITFDALPSAADSAAALAELNSLKAELDTMKNVEAFVNNNSTTKYFDFFIPNSASRHPYKDSIKNLPVGTVYGPYIDQNTIAYAKVIDRKVMPDTVKFRHIFIAIKQGESDSAAKAKADSLSGAIAKGADFAQLVATFSDDQESKAKNGEYEMTPNMQFVPEIKDFVFAEGSKAAGTKVLKLPVGYSVLQVMEQKNFGPAMKVAYLTKTVDPSAETTNKAYSAAGEFAAKYKDKAAFDKAVQEAGLTKRIANDIRSTDLIVRGLGESQELVKWAYKSSKGAVSDVISLDDRYLVAALTGIRTAGVATAAEAGPQVEPIVRQIKKAGIIAEKFKNPANLQAAADATKQPIMQAKDITFVNAYIPTLGFEPRVAGASFDKSLTSKVSAPIHGQAGVYVIKVDGYVANPNNQTDYAMLKNAFEQGFRGIIDQTLFTVLKKQANVTDDRGKIALSR